MSDRDKEQLPFDSTDASEQALWAQLKDLPRDEPTPHLRLGFYRALDHASSETWLGALRRKLGFENNIGWVTAAACGVFGFVLAGQLTNTDGTGPDRLASLEENVALLNRELILDRLQDANAGTRLRGVFDARASVADERIVEALLLRAAGDRVSSVRTAAIDVLGENLTASGVSGELMSLLEQSESPTVQLALVDAVLRNGSREQIDRLMELVRQDRLHPDLANHVQNSLGSETV